MRTIGRRAALRAAALLGLPARARPAGAQPAAGQGGDQRGDQGGDAWPSRPVRVVVPFVPGGPTDTSMRIVAERLRERLGRPFVIENRGGAGGLLGAQVVAGAAPDGHTLLYTSSSIAIGPSLQPGGGLDPIRDLAPVSLVTDVATTFAVRPDAPIGSIADLVARAKAAPGTISYGTSGVGSSNHLTAALLAFTAGIEMLHVPFRGTSQVATALLGGTIDMLVASTAETLVPWRDGKLKLLGVATAARAPALPDVPAVGETLPGYVAPNWFALFAPAGTPRPIVARLEAELAAIGRTEAVRGAFANLGIAPVMSDAATMRARMAEDVPRWRQVIERAGIRAE